MTLAIDRRTKLHPNYKVMSSFISTCALLAADAELYAWVGDVVTYFLPSTTHR